MVTWLGPLRHSQRLVNNPSISFFLSPSHLSSFWTCLTLQPLSSRTNDLALSLAAASRSHSADCEFWSPLSVEFAPPPTSRIQTSSQLSQAPSLPLLSWAFPLQLCSHQGWLLLPIHILLSHRPLPLGFPHSLVGCCGPWYQPCFCKYSTLLCAFCVVHT